jgi:WD40 repeat protein
MNSIPLLLASIVCFFLTNIGFADDVIYVPVRRHHLGNAHSVAFSADGRWVAAGFGGPSNGRFPLEPRGGGVIVWDAKSGKQMQAQGEYGDIIGLHFLADGNAWLHSRVYTPGDSVDDNVSRLVSVETGKTLHRWSWHDTHVAAVSPAKPIVAVVGGRELCRVFTLIDGKVSEDFLPISLEDSYNARCLAFSVDGGTLAAVHEVLEPIVRDDGTVATGRAIRVKGLAVFETEKWTLRERAIDERLRDCTAVAVSRDGRWIATGHGKGIARIWNGLTLEQTRELDLKTAAAVLPRFSPDGARLAVLTQPANSSTWEYANPPSGFKFGREQVGTSCDLVLYDTTEFVPQRHFRFADGTFRTYHANRPRESLNPARLAFSPDGKQLLVGADGVVLIDAQGGHIVRQFDAVKVSERDERTSAGSLLD